MMDIHYSDQEILGIGSLRAHEARKWERNSECVIYNIRTSTGPNRSEWTLTKLINGDKRIKDMLERGLNFTSALGIQRYSWPQLHQSDFPTIIVAPRSSGKSYAHLMYIITRIMEETPITNFDSLLIKESSSFGVKTVQASQSVKQPDLSNIDQYTFDFNSLGNKTNGDQDEPTIDTDHLLKAHVKYVIVCSSQLHVDHLQDQMDRLKMALYDKFDNSSKIHHLPPRCMSLSSNLSEDELAYRCRDSDLLIGSPKTLVRCLQSGYLNFSLCRKIFFDDLDLTLQLQSTKLREMMKYYVEIFSSDQGTSLPSSCDSGIDATPSSNQQEPCQLYMFSRKWTSLVKQFSDQLFSQKIILFGSLAEASLYVGIEFDIELCSHHFMRLVCKLCTIIDLHLRGRESHKMAIICKTDEEAHRVYDSFKDTESVKHIAYLPPTSAVRDIMSNKEIRSKLSHSRPIYLVSDTTIEFLSNELGDVTHLLHFSMPDDISDFHARFRLMFKHIKEPEKPIRTTIILPNKDSVKHAKELYDIISRSAKTQTCTKKLMHDIMRESISYFCWRWASRGTCRFEKLSGNDCFGSYCSDRHMLFVNQDNLSRWPTEGQVKISITYLVNPNEFYFMFEAHRDANSMDKKWTDFESSGSKFFQRVQTKLNRLKDTKGFSVRLEDFKKGSIFGIYFPEETKVSRVRLLEDPPVNSNLSARSFINTQLEYSFQCLVVKVDYGVKISVYLRNLFYLPDELRLLPAQCYRAFYIGIQPASEEPYWDQKAIRYLRERLQSDNKQICTAWLRLTNNNCFWFENLILTRKLSNYDGSQEFIGYDPYQELLHQSMAIKSPDPKFLNSPSMRNLTLSKWHIDKTQSLGSYAFLRQDLFYPKIYVCHIFASLTLAIRSVDFNQQLINLEEKMLGDYKEGNLTNLSYLKTGTYCLARIPEGDKGYTINRCKIRSIRSFLDDVELNEETLGSSDDRFWVECLDHGDTFDLKSSDLYLAPAQYLTTLPFQVIRVKLADIDQSCIEDEEIALRVQNLVYDLTRDSRDNLKSIRCHVKEDNEVYLYIPISEDLYRPLVAISDQQQNLCFKNSDPKLRVDVRVPHEDPADFQNSSVDALIASLTRDIISRILDHERSKQQPE